MGGGFGNYAPGVAATIGGGEANDASAQFALAAEGRPHPRDRASRPDGPGLQGGIRLGGQRQGDRFPGCRRRRARRDPGNASPGAAEGRADSGTGAAWRVDAAPDGARRIDAATHRGPRSGARRSRDAQGDAGPGSHYAFVQPASRRAAIRARRIEPQRAFWPARRGGDIRRCACRSRSCRRWSRTVEPALRTRSRVWRAS